jgi:DNA-binding IclR family transcriptional regulator
LPQLGCTIRKWHTSAVSRIARRLEGDGYLERDAATKRYGLGLKVYELGVRYHAEHSAFARLNAALDEIAIRTGHTAYFGASRAAR